MTRDEAIKYIEAGRAQGIPDEELTAEVRKRSAGLNSSPEPVDTGMTAEPPFGGLISRTSAFPNAPTLGALQLIGADPMELAKDPAGWFKREGLAGILKLLASYAGGAAGGRLLPMAPAAGSIIGQILPTMGIEALREKALGEPIQPGRIATEGAMIGGFGAAEAGLGKLMLRGHVPPEAIGFAYREPGLGLGTGRAFKPVTTAERIAARDELQASLADATAHPSPGKNRLNFIINEADKRVGLPPNTLGGVETPAGMVDGRALVDSLRGVVRGAGDAGTKAAEATISQEADDMLRRVAERAANHPQNRPGVYGEGGVYRGGGGSVVTRTARGRPGATVEFAPGGPLSAPAEAPTASRTQYVPGPERQVNADRPLWITHREYDQLLREHLVKPSVKTQQAAEPAVTTVEATADTLRDEARAAATDYGYRQLNREGVTYPAAAPSGLGEGAQYPAAEWQANLPRPMGGPGEPVAPPYRPVTAREAGAQAQGYLNTIEKLKSYFPKGKPSKPAIGGVARAGEAGEAMLSKDASELGHEIEQTLQDYQRMTGQPVYDQFKEIAMRDAWNKKEAQPYLENMARIFIGSAGPHMYGRAPSGTKTGRLAIKASMRPVLRSPLATAAGGFLFGQDENQSPPKRLRPRPFNPQENP